MRERLRQEKERGEQKDELMWNRWFVVVWVQQGNETNIIILFIYKMHKNSRSTMMSTEYRDTCFASKEIRIHESLTGVKQKWN